MSSSAEPIDVDSVSEEEGEEFDLEREYEAYEYPKDDEEEGEEVPRIQRDPRADLSRADEVRRRQMQYDADMARALQAKFDAEQDQLRGNQSHYGTSADAPRRFEQNPPREMSELQRILAEQDREYEETAARDAKARAEREAKAGEGGKREEGGGEEEEEKKKEETKLDDRKRRKRPVPEVDPLSEILLRAPPPSSHTRFLYNGEYIVYVADTTKLSALRKDGHTSSISTGEDRLSGTASVILWESFADDDRTVSALRTRSRIPLHLKIAPTPQPQVGQGHLGP